MSSTLCRSVDATGSSDSRSSRETRREWRHDRVGSRYRASLISDPRRFSFGSPDAAHLGVLYFLRVSEWVLGRLAAESGPMPAPHPLAKATPRRPHPPPKNLQPHQGEKKKLASAAQSPRREPAELRSTNRPPFTANHRANLETRSSRWSLSKRCPARRKSSSPPACEGRRSFFLLLEA